MSIAATGVAHIINAVENLIYLIDSQYPLNISTDSDEKENYFIKLNSHLKNGKSELRIYDRGGCFYYFNIDGKNLESIEFNEHSLTDTNGSFHKALKALIAFDRQNSSQQVKNADSLIDRASFGLSEVN